MGITIKKTISGRRLESRPNHGCSGCAAENDEALCRQLGNCVGLGRGDGVSIIWIESAGPARLTKTEIDDLKQRAIDQYGATWLHHFGSFVEAEVYQRLGHPLPEVTHG